MDWVVSTCLNHPQMASGSRQPRRAAAAEDEAEPVFDPSKEPGAHQPLATLNVLGTKVQVIFM